MFLIFPSVDSRCQIQGEACYPVDVHCVNGIGTATPGTAVVLSATVVSMSFDIGSHISAGCVGFKTRHSSRSRPRLSDSCTWYRSSYLKTYLTQYIRTVSRYSADIRIHSARIVAHNRMSYFGHWKLVPYTIESENRLEVFLIESGASAASYVRVCYLPHCYILSFSNLNLKNNCFLFKNVSM
jgi:hypothetical protein